MTISPTWSVSGLLAEESRRLNHRHAIYREVIPARWQWQTSLRKRLRCTVRKRRHGSPRVDKLLRAFHDFWRRGTGTSRRGLSAIARRGRTSCDGVSATGCERGWGASSAIMAWGAAHWT